jgi:hypothetical protein
MTKNRKVTTYCVQGITRCDVLGRYVNRISNAYTHFFEIRCVRDVSDHPTVHMKYVYVTHYAYLLDIFVIVMFTVSSKKHNLYKIRKGF